MALPYIAACRKCPFTEEHLDINEGQKAAVWHVYEEHRNIWVQIHGNHMPRDDRPKTGYYAGLTLTVGRSQAEALAVLWEGDDDPEGLTIAVCDLLQGHDGFLHLLNHALGREH